MKTAEEQTTHSSSVNMDNPNEISAETHEFFDGDHLRCRVFHDKYALRDDNGHVTEKTPVQMWRRVANAIASVELTEKLKEVWSEKFNWLLEDFRFIPGGRILFGAGAPRNVTLLNCYVNPVKDDSIESIFDWMKEAARTYSYGGGVGTDISVLRPKGAKVNNAALTSTGSVSFMDLFSLTTGTIGQAGRRGALMITMRDSHPDILDFIKVKRNLGHVRYANISVRISDALMEAVENDSDFTLSYVNGKTVIERTVRARELWKEMTDGARDWAEPGVLFWDTVLRECTSNYSGMTPISTNPCGEIPLEGYGDCCLGSINLSKFVTDEFTLKANIDWESLEQAVRYGARFLDNVLDYNAGKHPLQEQTEASIRSRRIGIGFTGLGDMLCQMSLRYDSDTAIKFTGELFERIKNIAYDESVNLAIEKGAFPAYCKSKHIKSPFIQRLNRDVLAKLKRFGLRNVALLTVPPVGSGAALAGTTSGIEPIFDLSYTRRSESLKDEYFKVYHPLVQRFLKKYGLTDDKELPNYFVTAHKISPEKRVSMQAEIQKHIDHSISSTVNLPRTATNEDVSRIYFLAWKTGCKGITVYREGSREGVLISQEESLKTSNEQTSSKGSSIDGQTKVVAAAQFTLPRPRPKVTDGRTEKVITPRGPIYVTINEDDNGLCEMFVRSLDAEAEAFGRLTSLTFRAGVDPREVIEQLWSVTSREMAVDRSDSGTVVNVTTVAQGISLAIARYLYGPSFNPRKTFPHVAKLPEIVKGTQPLRYSYRVNGINAINSVEAQIVDVSIQAGSPSLNGNGHPPQTNKHHYIGSCPDCGYSLVSENGCDKCRECGYSKCG